MPAFRLSGLLLALFLPAALAAPPSPAAPTVTPLPYGSAGVVINERERSLLRDWQRQHPQDLRCTLPAGKALPKGQQKKLERTGQVSVGWQKKLARGEVLSAEAYQHCRHLPPALHSRLPPPPPGTELIAIEGKVLRVLQATREILDVFELH